jgi:hypothetical protein
MQSLKYLIWSPHAHSKAPYMESLCSLSSSVVTNPRFCNTSSRAEVEELGWHPRLPRIDPRLPRMDPRLPRMGPRLPRIDPRLPRMGPRLPRIDPRLPRNCILMLFVVLDCLLQYIEHGIDGIDGCYCVLKSCYTNCYQHSRK